MIPARRGHRVICLDDDAAILAALLRTFREEAFEVFPTQDPVEALGWLQEGSVAAVVADYRMPGTSGTVFLEQARAVSPYTARILLTGFAGEAPVLAARKAGLFTLIAKPWDDRELRRTLRDQLRDRELEGDPSGLKRYRVTQGVRPNFAKRRGRIAEPPPA